jgi:hypothetical protein
VKAVLSSFTLGLGGGGGSGLLGLEPLALLLVRGQGAQLEGVDAALAVHLVLEEGVDHAVAGGLHLGLESVGDDDESRSSSDVSAGSGTREKWVARRWGEGKGGARGRAGEDVGCGRCRSGNGVRGEKGRCA